MTTDTDSSIMDEMYSKQCDGPAIALTIAGSDSSGGAGVQADLKTFTVLGVYGASVVTAITAQNTHGVQAAQLLDTKLIAGQINSVASDLSIGATKTGMLGSVEIIDVVADGIERHGLGPVVVDPVMVAKSGDALIDEAAVSRLTERMLSLATLLTPNRHEAARLLGLGDAVDNVDQAGNVAGQLCDRFGCGACIVKGISRGNGDRREMVDVLFDKETITEFPASWLKTNRTHGSGCTFSAAITAALASGRGLLEAIQQARAFISRAIERAPALGHGNPPVSPLAHLRTEER
jgi:hydroxymethylpyrimidine/phosphomethylpyrimidine kinase